MSKCTQCQKGFVPKSTNRPWWEDYSLCSERCAWQDSKMQGAYALIKGLKLTLRQSNSIESFMEDYNPRVFHAMIVKMNMEE